MHRSEKVFNKNYNKYYIVKRDLQKPFYQNSCKKKKFSKKKILSEMLRLKLDKNSSKYGGGECPHVPMSPCPRNHSVYLFNFL